MPGLTGSKRFNPLPRPEPEGIGILIIASAALITGSLRGELSLTLMGIIFFLISLYAFIGVAVTALFYRKGLTGMSVRFVPAAVAAGQSLWAVFSAGGGLQGKALRLPGFIVRYGIFAETRDGRLIRAFFDPATVGKDGIPLAAEKRGAYYTDHDFFIISDALGLFRRTFALPQGPGPRLLAEPAAAAELIPVYIESGGNELREAPLLQRTDDLTDHRPYIPGDDPRRINWKLYGHMGDLFVRDGEREPPPHSKLVILIDSSFDASLYSLEQARDELDVLCEYALALAAEYHSRGLDILVGYSGATLSGGTLTASTGADPGGVLGGNVKASVLSGGTPAELAAALAHPAALPLDAATELPSPPDERGIMVLAMPRNYGDNTVLDRFIGKGQGRRLDLVFLYTGDRVRDAAELCVRSYGRRGGVYVRSIQA